MHSVWAKPLTYRKSLGKVKWTWLCSAGCRSPWTDVQKFLQVSTASVVYDTWHHTTGHSGEGDCRTVFATCWRQCPRGYLDTTSLLATQQRSLVHYLVHYSCLESVQHVGKCRLQLSPLSHSMCVWISNSLETRPVFAFCCEIVLPQNLTLSSIF